MVKNLPANAGDAGSIPGSGRSPGVGNGTLLQFSCLENHMDRGDWRAAIPGVAKTEQLSKQLDCIQFFIPFPMWNYTPFVKWLCSTSHQSRQLLFPHWLHIRFDHVTCFGQLKLADVTQAEALNTPVFGFSTSLLPWSPVKPDSRTKKCGADQSWSKKIKHLLF